ncbi:MAG: helix-turn-helix transcriptional regulator [Desulfobacterales bacterium]|nr:helix-turn-helix transcriptional regulator [Desulfobacterales bacterium]
MNKMDTSENREIGRIIKEIRVSLGLTQEQFAAKIGVTFSTVNRWENGRGAPSPLALRQINKFSKTLEREKIE